MYHIDVRHRLDIVFGTAGTELEVKHNLGAILLGVIPIKKDRAGDIYDSGTLPTRNSYFLKSDVNSLEATILLITGRG